MGCFFLIINLKNKDRFKNSKLCGLWKLPYRHHGAIKFKQNWVFLSNLRINILITTSVTRQYHPKVLERLHLLQCVSGHLQNTLPWAYWETQFLNSDTLVDASAAVYTIDINQGSPHFFGEDDIGSCTTVRGPASCVMWLFWDMLRYIIPNHQVFRKYVIFSLLAKCVLRPDENGFAGRIWPTGRRLENPDVQ